MHNIVGSRRASLALIGVSAIFAALLIPATSASADELLTGVDESGPAWVDDSISVPVAGVPYSDSLQSPATATDLTSDADGPYGGGYLVGNPPGLHSTITAASGGGYLITISGTPTSVETQGGQYNINYAYPDPNTGATEYTVMRLYWTVDAPLAAKTMVAAPGILSASGGNSITATVDSASAGTPTPTGTVQFTANGSHIGAAQALVNGVATAPSDLSAFVGSTESIVAHYNGDGENAASDSATASTYVYGSQTVTGIYSHDGTGVAGASASLLNSSGTAVDVEQTSSTGRYTLSAPVTDAADATQQYTIELAPTGGGQDFYQSGHTPDQPNVTNSADATKTSPNDWDGSDRNVYDSRPPVWPPTSYYPQPRVGSAFSYQVEATGDGTITYSLAPGSDLPAGLSLDGTTGIISGTPPGNDPTDATIIASSAWGSSDKQVVFQSFLPEQLIPAWNITSYNFQVGEPVTPTVLAYGDPTLSYSITDGALPDGVTLDTTTGVLEGTPTTVGPYSFTLAVSNGNGSATPAVWSGTVSAPFNAPVWIPTIQATLQVGVFSMEPGAASAPITIPGSPGPVTYELVAGSLPAGYNLDAGPDGNPNPIEGTPTTSGRYDFTVRAYNNDGTATREFSGFVLPVAGTVYWPDGTQLNPITFGVPFTQNLTADGSGTITYSLNGGAYPHGLTMSSTGVLSGTPTSAGSYNFSVLADNGTTSAIQQFQGNVLGVNTTTTVSAPSVVDDAQDITIDATVSGTNPTNFVIFKINGNAVGTGTVANGLASWTGLLPDGVAGTTVSVSGTYVGDDSNFGSQSNTVSALVYGSSSVSGVVSSNGAAVTGATVDLLYLGDVVDTDSTDSDGGYSFDLGQISSVARAQGNYTIRATLPDEAVLYYAAAGGVGEPAIDSVGKADATGPVDWTPTSQYDIYENIAPTFTDDTLATPRVGEAYDDSVVGDGTGALDYSYTGELPAGLTFSNGELSGTPTTAAAYDFTVEVSDLYGTASKEFSGTVLPAYIDPYWTDTTIAPFRLNDPYSDAVAALGDPTIQYEVAAGTLPEGILLDSSTGALTGTPTSFADYDFTLQAFNGHNSTDFEFSGSILPAYVDPSWTSDTLPDFRAGEPYDATVTAAGDPVISYILGGSLPDGVTLDSTTGEVSGTPTTAGPVTFSIRAQNAHAGVTENYSMTVLPSWTVPVWTDDTLATPQTGVAYSDGVTATGDGAITYSVAVGTLPLGLSLDSSDGTVAGTPTGTGQYAFTLRASTPNRSVDEAFSGTLETAPALTLSPNFVAGDASSGATFTLTGSRVADTATWSATLHSTPTVIGDGSATGGAIAATVTLPSGVPAGAHSVLAVTTASDGSSVTDTVWFTVLPSGAFGAVSLTGALTYVAPTSVGTASLPMTGTDATGGLSLSLAFLLAGALIVILRRRVPRNTR